MDINQEGYLVDLMKKPYCKINVDHSEHYSLNYLLHFVQVLVFERTRPALLEVVEVDVCPHAFVLEKTSSFTLYNQ